MPQSTTPARVLRVIWFALVMSTAIYAFVAYVVTAQHTHAAFAETIRKTQTLVLYALSVASFFAGTIAWNVMANRPLQLRMVTSMAIFESGSVFGLVAAFSANDWRLYLPAWLLTLIGFLRAFPGGDETATYAG